MKTLDDLLDEISEAATAEGIERSDRIARLRDMRSELTEAIEDVDAKIAEVEAAEEADTINTTLAVSMLREAADVRDELVASGTVPESEMEESGVWSHAELDGMQEEGILEAAARELVAAGKLVLDDEDDPED